MDKNFKRVKLACYMANVSMSVCSALPALLFLTFRNLYGISYSLLGLLILIFYSTQLIIDLIFSFFSYKFNIPATVKIMPVLTVIGLVLYSLSPIIFKGAEYIGLAVATVVFAMSAGLAEVLISPTIAAIPSDDPDREMSKAHSTYAWGVVFVVVFSTLFLLIFGQNAWRYLTLILAVIPFIGAVLFITSDIPVMETPRKASGAFLMLKNKNVWICVFAIFIGGAAECTMSQWSSSYLEGALGIDKIWGDVFGVALFAVMLGIGRSLYAKIGKNIERVLLLGVIGAAICYLIAAISPFEIVGLIACALTGFCTSMLWPGSLIVASERNPDGGVVIYAMMAAGGDLGASLAPQLVGLVTDFAIANEKIVSFAVKLGLTADQFGMKLGMLVGMIFPLIGIIVFARILKTRKNASSEENNI